MNDSNNELPQSSTITVNGVDVICHRDGSIEKIDGRYKDNRLVRTFGSNVPEGYRAIGINGKGFRVHRLICQAFAEIWEPTWSVDHVNGVKADNRPENLRQMETNSEHNRAFKTKPAGCSSKYRFVSRDKRRQKWQVQVIVNGKYIWGGYYDNEIEAARAGDALAKKNGFDVQALNRTHHPEV